MGSETIYTIDMMLAFGAYGTYCYGISCNVIIIMLALALDCCCQLANRTLLAAVKGHRWGRWGMMICTLRAVPSMQCRTIQGRGHNRLRCCKHMHEHSCSLSL